MYLVAKSCKDRVGAGHLYEIYYRLELFPLCTVVLIQHVLSNQLIIDER